MARKKDSGRKKQLEKNKRDKVEADKLGLNLKEYRQKRSAKHRKKTKVKKSTRTEWYRQECRLTKILNIKKAEEELDREGFILDKPVMDSGQVSQHYSGFISKRTRLRRPYG